MTNDHQKHLEATQGEILRRLDHLEHQVDKLVLDVQKSAINDAVQTAILLRIEDGKIPVGKTVGVSTIVSTIIAAVAHFFVKS